MIDFMISIESQILRRVMYLEISNRLHNNFIMKKRCAFLHNYETFGQ